MVIINRESGLDEVKIALERSIPRFYERIFCPIHSLLYDRLHASSEMEIIQNKMKIKPFPIFQDIEIETVNRCNGDCSFCPVNRHQDPRKLTLMSEELFYSIIYQLSAIDYQNTVCFNLNNEPLLDKRITEFIQNAREKLPKAHFIMYSNGSLFSEKHLEGILPSINTLYIDNYHNDRVLTEPVKKILQFIEKNPQYSKKLVINIIRKDAIRTTRGGLAGNRSRVYFLRSSCSYPFTQMNIRPDGKVSLCCNDALGKFTLGDLKEQSLLEIWNGEKFWDIRKRMLKGRHCISMCQQCDVFLYFPSILYSLKTKFFPKTSEYVGSTH